MPTMRECSHELYLAVYEAVRQGLAQGDGGIVQRVSRLAQGRDSVACLVMTLALIEARRGDPPRRKAEVCRGALCDRCGASGPTR
jgi:hypothetical protein